VNTEWSELLPTYLIAFCVITSWWGINVILPLYTHTALGVSIADAGLVFSVAFAVSLFVRIPSARFVRKHGKYMLLLSLAMTALAPLMYVFAYNLQLVLLARAVQGFWFAILDIVMLSLASLISTPRNRRRAILAYTAAIASGLIGGPGIGAATIAAFGVKAAFVVNSGFGFVALFLALFYLYPSKVWASIEPTRSHSMKDILSHKPLQGSFLTFFLFASLYGILLAYLPLYVAIKFNAAESAVTALFTGYYCSMLGVRLLLNRCGGAIGSRARLTFGFGGTIASVPILLLSGSFVQLIPLFALLGFCHGMVFPTIAVIVSEAVDSADIVLANSILSTSFDLGITAGPIIMAPIAQNYGIDLAIVSAGIISLGAITIVQKIISDRAQILENHSAVQ
jgi:DHA1 family inner membrane transport protein